MQIRLKNIGIVKDSTIILDGLTVITGKNNSGKTTVGKALYSLLDAVANIQRKAENDRCVYVINYLNNFGDTLVKELNVNVLLTTHSSNFMLALDAYMRKYEIAEKTNFYQTDILGDGFVQYRCVNNDMGMIYQDFLQYLSEVKMLRNKYLTKIEE